MKKMLKSVISFALAIVLVASGISYTKNVEAATDMNDWAANAIIAPVEGDLVGAGYIPVEFDNSMEGYTYTVYLDDKEVYWIGDDIVRTELGEEITEAAVTKTFTSDDEGKTEVYTTTVSAHEVKVVASNGENTYTATNTFYVSKKGMALGGDMSDKVSLSKLNCSWYYNWATTAFDNSIDAGVSHIPMMWGGAEDNQEAMATFETDSNYILGFNEPDIGTQANMYFFDAIDVWNEYISPLNMRNVSPAPASPGGDSKWLKQFMFGEYKCKSPWDDSWGLYDEYLDDETKTWVAGISEDVDSVCLHYYRSEINLEGLVAAVETLWETYHKPIWITELSIFGRKGTTVDFSYEIPERREQMAEYVQGCVETLDAIPYVERYCWFSYNIDSTNEIDMWNGSGATAMFDYESGNYTELGRLYSNIGNPVGYNAEKISQDEMYVYVTEEPSTEAPTTEKPTEATTVDPTVKEEPTTQVSIPAKVKINKAKNINKKSVKVTWKSVSGAKKYQVQYALNKKFTKKVKTKTTKKLNIKINKLKKKNYYFRVRAINSAGNGKWSKAKKVKVSK